MSTVYDEKLLDKVKLAMIPSGYTNNVADENNAGGALGKVYSVLPAQTIGDNIVTNGTFDDTSFWNIGANWSIGGGVATSSGGFSSLSKGSLLEVGKTYRCTFEITSYTSGYVQIVGGTAYYGQFNSEETHTVDIKVSGTETFYVYSNNFIGSVDNVKLQLISDGDFDFSRGSDATRVNKDGLIESVQIVGEELVQNGDFEELGDELVTNGDFSDGENGWNLANNNKLSVLNNKIYFNADSGFSSINQDSVFDTSKIYKITFDFDGSGVTSGTFKMDGGTFSNYSVAERTIVDGFNVFYLQPSLTSFRVSEGGAVGVGIFDNISVKEVGQNWTFVGDATMDGSKGVFPAPSQYSQLTSSTPIVANKKYRFNADINFINAVNNSFGWRYTGGPIVNINSSDVVNGKYSQEFTAPSNGSFWFQTVGGTYPGVNVEIDNVSLIEVTDDTDIPRLDYSNSACPSLLIEPARANKLLESENFDRGGSFWNPNNNSVSIEGGYLAPDGTTNAYKITQGSNKAAAILYTGSGGILGTDARSIWAKTTGGSGQVNLCSHNLNTNNLFTVTENWQRFEVLGTTSTAGDTNFYAVDFRAAATNLTEVIIWGAQSEVGDYVTSYIPTRGVSETRNEDFCDNAGDSTIFNSQEGVLFAEIAALHDDLTFRVIGLGDDTNSNIIKFGYRPDSNNIYYEVRDGNVSQAFQLYQVSDITDFHKVAIKFKENDFAMWIDGEQVKTDTAGTVPSGMTMINFDGGNGAANFLGEVRSLLYFDEALSDAELEYITSADIDLTVHNYKGSLNKISATYEDVGVKDRLTKLF